MQDRRFVDSNEKRSQRRKKRHRVRKFFRGYFTIVGILANMYVFLRIVVWLLVEVAKAN